MTRRCGLFAAATAATAIMAAAAAPSSAAGDVLSRDQGHRIVAKPGTGSGTVLRYHDDRGRAVELRRTEAPVSDAVIRDAGVGGVVFASWEEGDAAHFVSISKDGGRSWSRARAVRTDIPLRAGTIDPFADAPQPATGFEAKPSGRVFLLQFHTPSMGAYRERLAALGVEVLQPMPHNAHVVRMGAGQRNEVLAEPFVRWVSPFHPSYRIDPQLLGELDALAESGEIRRYVIQVFTRGPAEKALLAGEVAALGGDVVLATLNGFLLEARLTADQVRAIAHSDSLHWIEPWTPRENDMDIARMVSGADFIETAGGYDGTGVRGEVMDSGVDMDHTDFVGMILHGGADESSHGTSTYGIVFGKGIGDPMALGHLPGAQGYFADYDFLADRYAHTAEIVQAPIDGVFQSNSWGNARTFFYTSISQEMDDIIWMNDIPIFQSQSNAGNQDSRPQAWAKNVISVGGVRHYNTATLADDCWCGGASIGPADDGRIKPDLSHFYDSTYCTDLEPGGYTAGSEWTPGFGGTSGATPITAGLGGLMLQMWADNIFGNNPVGTTVFEKRPHSSTTKAILINTAEQYPFSGPTHDLTRVNQGWGMANVRNVYECAPLMKIIDESSVLANLESDTYLAAVPSGQAEFKATMVYTDRAGSPSASVHRINDVTLRVRAPDGTVYWGNNGLYDENYSAPGGSADTINTVENVFVQNPAPGNWTIDVMADEVVQDVHVETGAVDQDYALVVYGINQLMDCSAAMPPAPTAVNAMGSADNEITVTWNGTAPRYEILRGFGPCGTAPLEFVAEVMAPPFSFVDSPVSGGTTYSYVIRSLDPCPSADSTCVEATTTGPCIFDVSFDGLQSAAGTDGTNCRIELDWDDGSTMCSGPVVYNIYRSTDPAFVPDVSNRLQQCLPSPDFVDTGVMDGQTYYYVVRAEDLGGIPNGGPCGGREDANVIKLAASPGILHQTDFENGFAGWSNGVGTPQAVTGDWVVGDPVGTFEAAVPAQPEDDHTAAPGVNCLYTAENPGGVIGAADIDGGEVVALSPVFDASGFTSVSLSLWRWHYIRDVGEDDYYFLEVTNDGSAWFAVESMDTNTFANSWNQVLVNLESVVPLSATMQLRVRSADGNTNGNIVETAIDDVVIRSNTVCMTAACAPGPLSAVGNTVRAIKAPNDLDVDLMWTDPQPDAASWNVYRSTVKNRNGTPTSAAATSFLDVGAIPAPGDYFYKLVAVDCALNEGPF